MILKDDCFRFLSTCALIKLHQPHVSSKISEPLLLKLAAVNLSKPAPSFRGTNCSNSNSYEASQPRKISDGAFPQQHYLISHTSANDSNITPLASSASGSNLGSEFRISLVNLFLNLVNKIGSSRLLSFSSCSQCSGIDPRRGSSKLISPVTVLKYSRVSNPPLSIPNCA